MPLPAAYRRGGGKGAVQQSFGPRVQPASINHRSPYRRSSIASLPPSDMVASPIRTAAVCCGPKVILRIENTFLRGLLE